MKIALSYAMAGEIASILPPEAQPLETVAGVPFYAIDENITAYCGGIGKVNAAITTQLLIDHFDIESVINTGIAGGAHPEIKVRDVVISDIVAYHDMDPRILAIGYPHLQEFTADPELIRKAEQACEGKVRWMTGKVATGDQFISDSAQKAAASNSQRIRLYPAIR